jgi:2-polyprenyl-3-methyl-5-hydroxy-6-metoxy-1,4-benzoquinol methylase
MVTATPDMHRPAAPDPVEVGLFALSVANQMSGAVTSAMIHLGDRLGLFRALADAGGPLTSAELAERTGLAERWVREWAYNQAAAGLIEADTSGDAERFSLAPAAVPVLADETNEMNLLGMFHQLPQSMSLLESALPESFRTGIGHDYDALGPEAAIGVERGFEPWMRNHLVDDLLPRLDGVVERLAEGAAAADVGCGAGAGVLRMAQAFPASRFAGYDISRHALDRAEQSLAASGLTNAEFHDPRERPLPADGSLAFVTTFDCLHDMTDPDGAARAIRAALRDDGTWLVADINAHDTFAENAERNPLAALMYGTSVLSCMSSALSEPGGAGLGTLGMSERRAKEMAASAGFTRFRRIDLDSPVNAFYEIRP